MASLAGRCERRMVKLLLSMGAALLAGCDPCSGVASCVGAPYLALDGQIVDAVTGIGVDGVLVSVIRKGGIVVGTDSVATTTALGGHWHVRLAPASAGAVDVEAHVDVPGGASYRVTGLHLSTTERGGEGNVLPPWVSRPYFSNAAELFVRGTTDQRLQAVPVDFRRTGGVGFVGDGVQGDAYRTVTDSFGRIILFPLRQPSILALGVGDVIGSLVVRPSRPDSAVIPDVHVRSSYLYRDQTRILRLGVGPSLEYQGEFYDRATGARQANVAVDFLWTGGVPVAKNDFTEVSRADGRFSFHLRPLTDGNVFGRLIFRAPVPATPETLSITIPTFEDDAGRFFGVIASGAYFPYYGVLTGAGVGLDGVKIDAVRVSGVPVVFSAAGVETSKGGVFRLGLVPLELGTVVLDLTFHPPAPAPAFTRRVTLSTADRTVEDRLIGTFAVP